MNNPIRACSKKAFRCPMKTSSLKEIALVFLKLGTTAFGGPAAHIAMMEDEVVRRRKWIERSEFLDLLGATNFIPGPNSTEMAIHIGHLRAGWRGLIVAGVCFILPAALIVTAIAWAYTRYGNLPSVDGILFCVKPVIIAVVIQALWGLGRTAIKTWPLALICILAIIANAFGMNEVFTIFIGGVISYLFAKALDTPKKPKGFLGLLALTASAVVPKTGLSAGVAMLGASFSLSGLFYFFLKVGSVLFGSGYVLLAFLRTDLVERFHWLTEAQLLDATAVGQFTPGPVFTTATFIGYLLSGPTGALLATVGIFLPAFIFVAISAPLIPRLKRSAGARVFLDGVNVASLALMAVVTWHLGRAAIVDITTASITIAAAFALIRYRINSAWLVLAGGLVGLIRLQLI
ncbi:MAG: chromate transporter [Bdellovibrionales bacterium GWA2_49_15]|nr:MAG: chromate transporter [Bdellovibrionales bacterium GWA2_49_15]HAZ14697.1 chromate transporter [Bdellovibrionales bacterium]